MQAMQVDEALEHADEWIKGVTLYEGAQGWRVACATLAAEVRRLREIEATAARVWRKYGAESDWTEWCDLGEALGMVPNA